MQGGFDNSHEAGRGLTADDIRNVAFTKPPIGRRGYTEDAVDEFLERVESELRSGHFTLTVADIRGVTFPTPRFGRRGYDEQQVDAFIDLIESEIRRRGQR